MIACMHGHGDGIIFLNGWDGRHGIPSRGRVLNGQPEQGGVFTAIAVDDLDPERIGTHVSVRWIGNGDLAGARVDARHTGRQRGRVQDGPLNRTIGRVRIRGLRVGELRIVHRSGALIRENGLRDNIRPSVQHGERKGLGPDLIGQPWMPLGQDDLELQGRVECDMRVVRCPVLKGRYGPKFAGCRIDLNPGGGRPLPENRLCRRHPPPRCSRQTSDSFHPRTRW